MPEVTEKEMQKIIKKGEFGGVYLFYGDEKYLLKKAAKKLISKSAGSEFLDFNLSEFTNDSEIDSIADSALALPFMSSKKCVAISDFNLEEKNQNEISKLNELVETELDTTALVFYYPTLNVKKSARWRSFLKQVGKNGIITEFKRKESSDLVKILMNEAHKRGCILSKPNATTIIEYSGTDMNGLLNELDKLCSFAGEAEITRAMIEELVPKSMETNAFMLSNSIIWGNYEKAYSYMDALFYANNEPIVILSALSTTYVDMYRVKAAIESGMHATSPKNYGEYGGKTFRLTKAEKNVKGVSLEMLRKSLNVLIETDVALKSSRLDSRIIMDSLIAKLLLIAKGEKT